MTFYTWMIKNHRREASPIGKLADDMHSDRMNFTRGKGYRRNRDYLELCNASKYCLDAFEEAWVEYTKYKQEQKHARENH